MCFGRFDAERLAVKIEIETLGGAVPSANGVESELLSEIAVRCGLVPVTEPIFARDGNIQERGTEINEGNIEAAAVESDDRIVARRDLPKSCKQFTFLHTWDKLDWRGFVFFFRVIVRDEQHLPALGISVEHRDADHARGERIQIHLHFQFRFASVTRDGIRNLVRVAKKIFLLDLIEVLDRQRGSFDIEDECGHQKSSAVLERLS